MTVEFHHLRQARPISQLPCRVAAVLALACLALPLGAQEPSFDSKEIEYFKDKVYQIEDRVAQLLGGSRWLLGTEPLLPVLPLTDVVVVVERRGNESYGVFRIKRHTYVGILLEGQVTLRRGLETWVVRELGNGAVLRTADGSFWSVSSYDQYYTRFWLPPYRVIVEAGSGTMFVLDEGEEISVTLERGDVTSRR